VGGVAPRRGRSPSTAPNASAAGKSAGRTGGQGRGQESDRLWRLPGSGRIDGLLHITDMAWKRVNIPPSGQRRRRYRSQVLKFDASATGFRWAQSNWVMIRGSIWARRYPSHPPVGRGDQHRRFMAALSKSRRRRRSGACVRDGLDQQECQPNKWFRSVTKTEVMVLDIDEERRRISLGMKQCQPIPGGFRRDSQQRGPGRGKIKSITDFGIVCAWRVVSTFGCICPIFLNIPGEERDAI